MGKGETRKEGAHTHKRNICTGFSGEAFILFEGGKEISCFLDSQVYTLFIYIDVLTSY